MYYNRFLMICTGILVIVFFLLLNVNTLVQFNMDMTIAVVKILGVIVWFIMLSAFLAQSNFKSSIMLAFLGFGIFCVSLVEMHNAIAIWSALLPGITAVHNYSLMIGKASLALTIILSIYFDKLLKEKYFSSEKVLQRFLGILSIITIILILISAKFASPLTGDLKLTPLGIIPIIMDFGFILLIVSIGFEAFSAYRQFQSNVGLFDKKDFFFNKVNWGLIAMDEEHRVIICNSYLQEKINYFYQPGQILEERLAQFFPRTQGPAAREITLPTPHGPVNLLLELSPITTPSGEYGGQVAIVKDLDEIKKAEMERISYRLIFASLPAGLIVVDQDKKLFFANAASERLLECGLTSSLGKPLQDVLKESYQDKIINLVQDSLHGHAEVVLKDLEISTAQNHKILYLIASPIINIRNEIIGAFCIILDVTAEKMHERNLRRTEHLAALGELSAAVAHEIRNPLTSIQGFLQLMCNKQISEQHKEYIQIMLAELKRTNDIISEFLAFARPQKLNMQKQDLNLLIKETVKIMECEFDLQKIHIVTSCSKIPALAFDRDQLKQVLLNLFRNSLQAMSPGGRLQVSTAYDSAYQQVSINIQDDGEGIPPENIEKIFIPFFTTKESGTGLGLSICSRIIQNHGGKLEVTSQVGQGTTFTITLPQVDNGQQVVLP